MNIVNKLKYYSGYNAYSYVPNRNFTYYYNKRINKMKLWKRSKDSQLRPKVIYNFKI